MRREGKAFISLITAFAMTGCSRVSLEAKPIIMESLAPSLNLTASICPQRTTTPAAPTSFLFVIDMSTSNIGAPLKKGIYSYWDPTKATDGTGARFDAIEYFLNNCANANARFAVIGFSEGVGQVVGSGMSASWSTDCNSITFGGPAASTAVIEGFRSEQAIETQWYDQWINQYLTTTSFPPIMRGTNYIDALKCADQIINSDLTSPTSTGTQQYQVIFLTDGAPTDPVCNQPGWTPAAKQACYAQQVNLEISDMRQSALAMALDLRLSTVFYGNFGGAGVPPVLALMSNDGGTPAPMKLATFQNNQKALCSLINSELSVAFAPDFFFAANMTTINKGGVQKPDSDMDGIPDDEEAALGYDPLNPRSRVSGVLDGVCERLGGLAKCQQLRSQITCDPNQITDYLSDCDIKILKLDKVLQNPTLGLDSDGDSIPDFLEIVKGLDPSFKDSLADPDGDGVVNLQEILQGTDPFTRDADFPVSKMTQFNVVFNPQSAACTDGGWDLSVSQTSTSPTRTFNSSISDLSHGAGDQVLWIGFRMVPKNSGNQYSTFYGKMVTVSTSADGLTQTATPAYIPNDGFTNLGQVLP
jgi:hypothetical protein